jgi:hypothetical protein
MPASWTMFLTFSVVRYCDAPVILPIVMREAMKTMTKTRRSMEECDALLPAGLGSPDDKTVLSSLLRGSLHSMHSASERTGEPVIQPSFSMIDSPHSSCEGQVMELNPNPYHNPNRSTPPWQKQDTNIHLLLGHTYISSFLRG